MPRRGADQQNIVSSFLGLSMRNDSTNANVRCDLRAFRQQIGYTTHQVAMVIS